MSALVLDASDVRRLLPMETCIDLMADALATLGRGEAVNPLRQVLRLPGGSGILGVMPGSMAAPEVFGLKVISVFFANHGTEYDSHQGVVLLFETEHGAPVAVVDASEITATRTAAVSGVATRLLAREDAGDLAILGSGVQARSHLDAMACVRDLRRVRIWSPTRENRETFARDQAIRHGIPVEATETAEAAVHDADIVCTVTAASEPVLEGEWLAAGAHVNAVGASVPTARELDTAAMQRSRLFVDRRESAENEAGDYLIPLGQGEIDEDHILGEIGELLLGEAEGRTTSDDVTLFKSLGLAVEDLASAYHVYRRAQEEGAGAPIAIGGPVAAD